MILPAFWSDFFLYGNLQVHVQIIIYINLHAEAKFWTGNTKKTTMLKTFEILITKIEPQWAKKTSF